MERRRRERGGSRRVISADGVGSDSAGEEEEESVGEVGVGEEWGAGVRVRTVWEPRERVATRGS